MWDGKSIIPHKRQPHYPILVLFIPAIFSGSQIPLSYKRTNIHKIFSALKPDMKKEYLQATPLKRIATPEEVADAALFLASNRFANNCVLNLDGGLSAS